MFKLCIIKQEMRPLCSLTVVPLNLPPCDLSQSSDVRNRQKEASPTGLQWRRYIWNVFLSLNYFRKLMSSAHNGEKRICQTKDLLSRRGGLEAFVIFLFLFSSCLIMTDWYSAPARWRNGGRKLSHAAQRSTLKTFFPPFSLPPLRHPLTGSASKAKRGKEKEVNKMRGFTMAFGWMSWTQGSSCLFITVVHSVTFTRKSVHVTGAGRCSHLFFFFFNCIAQRGIAEWIHEFRVGVVLQVTLEHNSTVSN